MLPQRCQSVVQVPDNQIIKIQTLYRERKTPVILNRCIPLLSPNRRRFSDFLFREHKLSNRQDIKVIPVSTKNLKRDHDHRRTQSSPEVDRKQSVDIDFLVYLYSRKIRDSISSGIADFKFSMGSMIYSKPNTAVTSTTYDHAQNIFHLSLISTTFHSIHEVDKKHKIYTKIAFYAGKIQRQKTKKLPLAKEINWQTPFRFKHLTMKQLETGTLRLQFVRCSRFGFNRTVVGEANFVLHRHHYRQSHYITLVIES
ncbi:hypothetical protein SNE40_017216 [Patella caerulea]|uniref:Uncharacterized protein n=1 Tax=Patella caerulea TaxID=87958 RepID=A0AAN8JDC0_PATCE